MLLREGSSTQLKDVKAITDQGKDGTFTWTPDNDVKSGKTYAFQVKQGDQMNYTELLKSAKNPSAETTEDENTAATDTTTAPQTSESSAATATGTTLTTTSSKALISSSASASGTPSSSVAASSTDGAKTTGNEVVNGKAAPTEVVQTGAASVSHYSVHLVMGVAGLLGYLV